MSGLICRGSDSRGEAAGDAVSRLQRYFDEGARFHGMLSPGLVLGIFMVDLAQEILGPREFVDAVVETKACLPDAVQLMTSCSYGNGWMRVKDWGKLALTLYDKRSLEGVRVCLDLARTRNYPLIEQWAMRLRDIGCKEEVAREIMRAGRDILSWRKVEVARYRRPKNAPVVPCSSCGEAHPSSDGSLCQRCNGREDYYRPAGVAAIQSSI
ncbi:MAG: tRNA CCA-pyrophosphorylase [Chloroflexi bacterium]|nr:tRNA CCA-pyrophosphorylase [Chloroflexota bacterium]